MRRLLLWQAAARGSASTGDGAMIAQRQPAQTSYPYAIAKLNDLELLDARDRLLLAGLLGRHPRAAYAERLAAIEAMLSREAR